MEVYPYAYTRWHAFASALRAAAEEDASIYPIMCCYKRCFEDFERAWEAERAASTRRRPPPNFPHLAYVRERLRQHLTGQPFRITSAGLRSEYNLYQQHRYWRRCCLRLGWPALGPHDPREAEAAQTIQRAFRKRVEIPRIRAKIATLANAYQLPAHIHDEILRQYFKL